MSKYRFTSSRVLSMVLPFLPIAIALSRGSTSTTTIFLSGLSVTRTSFSRAGARLFLINASGVSAYSTTSIWRLVIRRSMLMFFPPFPIARPMSPGLATKIILSSFSSIIQSCVVAPVILSNRAMYFISSLVSLILGWSITFSQRPVSRLQNPPAPGRQSRRPERALHSHAYLLVNVDQSLLPSLPRHHHGHLYQPSAHRYLLTNNHVLRHTTQSISNTLDRRIHDRRDRNLKRCLGQSARLLAADTVTPHLQHITRRGHHIRDKHHMPNINIQPLLLQDPQRLLDNDIPGCFYSENHSGLVDVIAHSPGRIHSRNLQSESETRALSPDNPLTLLLNHQRTLHSRNTLDMGDRQLPG